MDDLISRQAAIDALEGVSFGNQMDKGRAMLIIDMLPSAQPEWAEKVEGYLQNVPSWVHKPLAWALYQTWKEYD